MKDKVYSQMEEVNRMRSRNSLNTGTSVPLGFEVHHSPGTWMYSPTCKLSEPLYLGILWRIHHIGTMSRSLAIGD